MGSLVHLGKAFAQTVGICAYPNVSGHLPWEGEEEERAAGEGRVDDVHARSPKDLFGEDNAHGDTYGSHPVRDRCWKDQDIEDACDKKPSEISWPRAQAKTASQNPPRRTRGSDSGITASQAQL